MAAAAVDDDRDDEGDGDDEDNDEVAAVVLTRTVDGADGLSAESAEVVGVLARPSTIDDAEFSSIDRLYVLSFRINK